MNRLGAGGGGVNPSHQVQNNFKSGKKCEALTQCPGIFFVNIQGNIKIITNLFLILCLFSLIIKYAVCFFLLIIKYAV